MLPIFAFWVMVVLREERAQTTVEVPLFYAFTSAQEVANVVGAAASVERVFSHCRAQWWTPPFQEASLSIPGSVARTPFPCDPRLRVLLLSMRTSRCLSLTFPSARGRGILRSRSKDVLYGDAFIISCHLLISCFPRYSLLASSPMRVLCMASHKLCVWPVRVGIYPDRLG